MCTLRFYCSLWTFFATALLLSCSVQGTHFHKLNHKIKFALKTCLGLLCFWVVAMKKWSQHKDLDHGVTDLELWNANGEIVCRHGNQLFCSCPSFLCWLVCSRSLCWNSPQCVCLLALTSRFLSGLPGFFSVIGWRRDKGHKSAAALSNLRKTSETSRGLKGRRSPLTGALSFQLSLTTQHRFIWEY